MLQSQSAQKGTSAPVPGHVLQRKCASGNLVALALPKGASAACDFGELGGRGQCFDVVLHRAEGPIQHRTC